MFDDEALEFDVESADGTVLSDIGVGEPARDDATDMAGFLEEDYLGPRAGGRHRGGDATRGGAHDDDIGLFSGRRAKGQEEQEGREERAHVCQPQYWVVLRLRNSALRRS